MRKSTIAILLIPFLFPAFVSAKNPAPKDLPAQAVEQFKKSFPKNNFESITATDIKGIYEIYTGNQIYYYIPKNEVIITGSIISKNGANITRESYNKKMSQKMAKLSLDSALKIGNGKKTVVEFIDINCHFCRESYKYFAKRNDVTVNVFFLPLSQNSADKTKLVLCSKEPAMAYEDAMNGKFDNTQISACTDKKVDETVKTHMKLASQIGVKATPLFYIKGQIVDGFEKSVIENLLKD